MRHRARDRSTKFELPASLVSAERPSMPAIYAALAQDQGRNDLIFDDVLKSLEAKRSPILLTERKDHLDYLQQKFSPFVKIWWCYVAACRRRIASKPTRR